jgi:hypothetical protein
MSVLEFLQVSTISSVAARLGRVSSPCSDSLLPLSQQASWRDTPFETGSHIHGAADSWWVSVTGISRYDECYFLGPQFESWLGDFLCFPYSFKNTVISYWPDMVFVLVQLEYLCVTVLRRRVGEVRVVAGKAPACWQVWRGMQYRRSQKEIISYLIVLHCDGGLVSMMFTHPMLSFMCRISDYYALYTVIYMRNLFTYYTCLF